jgi:hypothetical protein
VIKIRDGVFQIVGAAFQVDKTAVVEQGSDIDVIAVGIGRAGDDQAVGLAKVDDGRVVEGSDILIGNHAGLITDDGEGNDFRIIIKQAGRDRNGEEHP